MGTKRGYWKWTLLLAAFFVGCSVSQPAKTHLWEFQAPPRELEGLFCSMDGPTDQLGPLFLRDPLSEGEKLWLTGFDVGLVDPESDKAAVQALCHNSLMDDEAGKAKTQVFSLAQGNQPFHLPEGFAVPWESSRPFYASAQMMNAHPELVGRSFSHRLSIWYKRDQELRRKPKSLEVATFPLLVCSEQKAAEKARMSYARLFEGENIKDPTVDAPLGAHWWVPPGRHSYRYDVSGLLGALGGTRQCHGLSLHLHAWASHFALKDETTGETLWSTEPTRAEDGSLLTIGSYSSPEGLQLMSSHRLVMEVTYENKSAEDVSVMAVLSLYLAGEAEG